MPNNKHTEELKEQAREEIFEKLADIEHTRWAKWQKYMHSKCEELIHIGERSLIIPAGLVQRWERQIETPYSELSEQEKQSDREQVEEYWHIIDSLIDKAVQMERERIVGCIEGQMEDIEDNEYSIAWNDALKRIISLITNNSDINK